MQSSQLRSEVEGGAFVSLPKAFRPAEAGVRNALKLEFTTVYSQKNIVETVFSTDKLLIDFAAVDADAFDPARAAIDCDLLKQAILRHPKKLKRLLGALQRGGAKGADEAFELAKRLGLTEEEAHKRGGGFFWIVVLLGGALAGCGGSLANKAAKAKTTPSK